MREKLTVCDEGKSIVLAVELIQLGARLQVLEGVTKIARNKLLRLYKETAGSSPSKGQLPSSTDWFMGWRNNIHTSLFMVIYNKLEGVYVHPAERLINAFKLYHEQVSLSGQECELSITRAWSATRFFSAGLLGLKKCKDCEGEYVGHGEDTLLQDFSCPLCNPPSRAGAVNIKAKAEAEIEKA